MVFPTPLRAAEFKSAYGPKYHYQPNFHGWNGTALFRLGLKTAAFGGAGGIAALLFVSSIPRVKRDILQHIPVVGTLFVKEEVPASDSAF
ncbi:Uncharacterized protein TCAP_02907 [Tolypocladium capitatum]|uniref:Cytochrome b-c1 complex subunit 10 n=1 Tax=Tolypocladium capitatum TaxID=45235 RepID=A0A2K3QI31_9HYPO|nr:Uncharacterized protein TCAP_02907 [Tolypocladium capitatum]